MRARPHSRTKSSCLTTARSPTAWTSNHTSQATALPEVMCVRRLSSLGSKQLAHRKGRSALTALGIVLGVAILFGVLVTNATTQSGVDKLIKDFTGRANVLVSPTGAFDATMPATIVPKLAALPDVRAAVGSYNTQSSVKTPKVKKAVSILFGG